MRVGGFDLLLDGEPQIIVWRLWPVEVETQFRHFYFPEFILDLCDSCSACQLFAGIPVMKPLGQDDPIELQQGIVTPKRPRILPEGTPHRVGLHQIGDQIALHADFSGDETENQCPRERATLECVASGQKGQKRPLLARRTADRYV